MICGEVDETNGWVCDKEMVCTFTHETNGISWGVSAMPGSAKKGSTKDKADEIIANGIKPEGETGPPDLSEVFANLPAVGYGTTTGWSGTDTSHESTVRELREGITSKRQRTMIIGLDIAGTHGMTSKEFRERIGEHHGKGSSVATNLHKRGIICRLTVARDNYKIYVLPEYVDGREVEPFESRRDDQILEAKAVGWEVAHRMLCQGIRLHQVCAHTNPYEAASSGQVAS